MSAYGGDVALVTVTGPGRERLVHADDGLVRAQDRYRWNRSAPRHWRELHRAASQIARRRHGGTFSLVAASWEYQRRGVLHRHVVLGVGTSRERAAAQTYAQALADLRLAHDFGYVDRGRSHGGRRSLEVISAMRAGRYLAKYLSPLGADGKPTLGRTVMEPDVPPHVVHVSRLLTTRTGVTMRSLRLGRRLHYVARHEGVDLTGVLVVVAGSETESLLERGALLPRPPTKRLSPEPLALVA